MIKTFIIAEAGVNHNGDLELAYKLIDAAVEAKADAVKFQTFKAENVASKSAEKAEYQKKTTSATESQFEMIKKLELSYNEFRELKKYCDKIRIMFLSTPDEEDSLDFLADDLNVPIIKVGSGELTNLPFLRCIAQKDRPIILSTGMASLSEVEEAIDIIQSNQNCLSSRIFSPLTILHCTTNYPCPYEEVNLRAMLTLKEAFKLPVGYSDHTLGIEVSVAAVALGAKVIEKHFTLDKNLPGPDHKASLEPDELKAMVEAIRNVEKSLGDGIKRPTQSELNIMKVVRKSLVAARNIKAGEKVKESDIVIKKAGTGIPPKFKKIVIGMRPTRDIKEDEPLGWGDFK